MGLWSISLIYLCLLARIRAQDVATIIVSGSLAVAETDDNFVCATMDWWPAAKCNYNQCPWGHASVLNLDLHHPFLVNAIKAFKSLRIRLGGSLQDRVLYGVPGMGSPCLPFRKMAGGLFGFSHGCLNMTRWDELNALFQKTGAVVTFGLNALHGRHQVHNDLWEGAWDSVNARHFMEYTVAKKYPVDSWEFGNELSGHGIGASVSSRQYGRDILVLKKIIDDLYKGSNRRPLLVAPGGFYEQLWYTELLQSSGSNVVNAMTHHVYNLGAGNDPQLVHKILDPNHLNMIAKTYRDLQLTLKRHGPWASAWVGEAGGAFNSGGNRVSNTFLDSFWYLDQLGMAAKYETKTYCRQTLIGGYYGLLDTDSFVPNPDYYSALLWHRLMGKKVLSIAITGSTYLRAYAHCSKTTGISLLLINLSNNTEFVVGVRNDINLYKAEAHNEDHSTLHGLKSTMSWIGATLDWTRTREEYHLTGKDGFHRSRTILLNGSPLELTENGDIPAMNPIHTPANAPLSIAPLSIAFVVLPEFEATACK